MPVGRNDPCPCGSGKKYKKCCGAVIAIAASSARQCGECTACCDGWVTGVIEGHEMYPGTPCYFRGDQCCTIYERRPKYPCRDFLCGWLQPGSPFPEEFRPDRLGVMMISMKWRGRDAYMLRTGSPFFYEENGERLGFGPPEFQIEMAEKVARGERLW